MKPLSRNLVLQAVEALNESISSVQRTGKSSAFNRAPNFSKPAMSSTRPASNRGVTFHFAHKTISKSNDTSTTAGNITSAAPHQAYIERAAAVEKVSPAEQQAAGLIDGVPSITVVDGVQRKLVLSVDPSGSSFGTLGRTKAERQEFWRALEGSEPRKSRIQSRIIAELPHEISASDRLMAARDLCRAFDEEGLPYWASIHSPTKANDKRNYHLHVAYSDRPAGIVDGGRWDFTIATTKRKKSGNKVTHRPFRQNKSAKSRSIHWVKELRTRHSEAMNFALSMSGSMKRYDPRPYRESGVPKQPTEHLGSKSAALESAGLDTTRGNRNASREAAWRISDLETPWSDRSNRIDAVLVMADEREQDALITLRRLAEESMRIARNTASHSIAVDILSGRYGRRLQFIERQIMSALSSSSSTSLPLSDDRVMTSLDERARLSSHSDDVTSLTQIASKISTKGKIMLSQNETKFLVEARSKLGNNPALLRHVLALAAHDKPTEIDAETLSPTSGKPNGVVSTQAATTSSDGGERRPQTDEPIGDRRRAERAPSHDQATSGQRSSPATPTATPTATPPATPPWHERDDQDSVTRAVQSMIGGRGEPKLRTELPDAVSIAAPQTREDVARIDAMLAKMSNGAVRKAAIASRDLADLLPAGQDKTNYNRAWVVLGFECGRRGVDLDTGARSLAKATDKKRAELHADEDVISINEMRKLRVRQAAI